MTGDSDRLATEEEYEQAEHEVGMVDVPRYLLTPADPIFDDDDEGLTELEILNMLAKKLGYRLIKVNGAPLHRRSPGGGR